MVIRLKTIKLLLVSVLLACLLGGCITSAPEEPEVIPQIVLTPEYTEIQAPAKVTIEYEIVPEELTDQVTITGIQNSGVYIRRKGNTLLFKTENPGRYTVSLSGVYVNEEGESIDITSNEAQIVVKEAPAQEDSSNASASESSSSSSTEESTDASAESNPESEDSTAADSSNEAGSEPESNQEAPDVFAQPVSVDQALSNATSILEAGQDITIEGLLPQTLITLEDGTSASVIWNNNSTQYIILDNPDVLDIGGTRAQLAGTLSERDGTFYFYIKKFRQLN